MPGLVGFAKALRQEEAGQLLAGMARSLESEDRFRVELHSEDGCGIGRVTLGIVTPEPQPVWSADRSLCLVMEGELYDTDELRLEIASRGFPCGGGDAELALRTYEAFGEGFAVRLNGPFAIAIRDRREDKVVVVNDRLGQHPLYYARVGDGVVFGSGVRALLADPAVPRSVDRVAIAQFLTFDHALHDRTLLTAVRLLPQASMLVWAAGRFDIRQYWKLQFASPVTFRPETEYVDALIHLLKQAMRRQVQHDNLPSGFLLSGGLDSRLLLALTCETSARNRISTFTWGVPGCEDAAYASEVSRKLRIPHYFYPLPQDWLQHGAAEGVRITDGLANIVNLHALATLKEQTEHAQVIYKGYMGDAMLGYAVQLPFWADYDEATRARVHFQSFVGFGVITFPPEELAQLLTEPVRREVGDAVLDEMNQGMAASGSQQLAIQRLYFDLTQRVPRMTIHGVQAVRSRAAARLPFCDNDLVEFALQIPPGLQLERQLITKVFVRAFPELAKIPYTQTGLPMVACAREIVLRARRLVAWHLEKKGLGRFVPGSRPYQRYDEWFRTVLRGWVEETLLQPESLERGHFNPDRVRQIVTEHMNGANHTVKIGSLLSLELWHRLFLR